jgi:hypothetical protein
VSLGAAKLLSELWVPSWILTSLSYPSCGGLSQILPLQTKSKWKGHRSPSGDGLFPLYYIFASLLWAVRVLFLFIENGNCNCHTFPGIFSSPNQHMKQVSVICSKNTGVVLKNAYFQHVLLQSALPWQASLAFTFVLCSRPSLARLTLFMFFMKLAHI